MFDDLGPETDNAALRDLIVREIATSGPITFRRFMELVLYQPGEGYYSSPREKIGRSGDYLTSPEISPLFGYALARQVAEFWRCLGSPERFDLVEAGAGTGALAVDVLRWSGAREPEFYAALRYVAVELSPAMRRRQEDRLARWIGAGKAEIVERLEAFDQNGIHGCLLSNELLDSFPVHRVTVTNGRLQEIYVALESGRLTETIGDISTAALQTYFERLGLLPGEGCLAEVNLAALDWLQSAASPLRRGYILTLDYGYAAKRLYAPWRRAGTLLCFYRHTANDNPYIHLGHQDMTSHVDFSSLAQAALEYGFEPVAFADQSALLTNLGIGEMVRLESGRDLALEEYYARRRSVEQLLDPSGLGAVRALLLSKGAPACVFTGFRNTTPWKEAL